MERMTRTVRRVETLRNTDPWQHNRPQQKNKTRAQPMHALRVGGGWEGVLICQHLADVLLLTYGQCLAGVTSFYPPHEKKWICVARVWCVSALRWLGAFNTFLKCRGCLHCGCHALASLPVGVCWLLASVIRVHDCICWFCCLATGKEEGFVSCFDGLLGTALGWVTFPFWEC